MFCTFVSGIHTLPGITLSVSFWKVAVEVWGNKLWSPNNDCGFFLWKELNLAQCLISTVH